MFLDFSSVSYIIKKVQVFEIWSDVITIPYPMACIGILTSLLGVVP